MKQQLAYTPHDIYKIAAAAHVCASTVRRYVVDHLPVRPSGRARIEAALRDLGYEMPVDRCGQQG